MRIPFTEPASSKYEPLAARELRRESATDPRTATSIIELVAIAVISSILGFYVGKNSIKTTNNGLLSAILAHRKDKMDD
jgi:hypothetical protein